MNSEVTISHILLVCNDFLPAIYFTVDMIIIGKISDPTTWLLNLQKLKQHYHWQSVWKLVRRTWNSFFN